MATLEATQCVSTGIAMFDTENATETGDEFVNTGDMLLIVRNDGADPRTVTIPRTRLVDGQAAEDLTVTIPAEDGKIIGPFRPQDYNDEDDKVQVAYDAVTEDSPAPDTQTVFVLLVRV